MTDSLVSLETELIRIPLSRTWGPDVREMHIIVVRVRSSFGHLGTGFSWTPSIGAHAVCAMLDHDIAAHVIGGSIDPARVWIDLWHHLHEAGSGGVTTIAMAGLDLALYDLQAKSRSLSVVDLLGRRRDSVPVYGSGVNLHYSLNELVAQVSRWVAAGVDGVKVKVGKADLSEDLDRVAAVRETLGAGPRLMIDANQRWDLCTARTAIAALSRFDLQWVEEPLLADDTAGYIELRSSVDVPLAAGENAHTEYRFRDLIEWGALDIVQPNVVRVGGITPFQKIVGFARDHGIQVAPHLLPELSGQLALTMLDEVWVEDVEDARFEQLGALAAPSGVRIDRGRLTASTGAGLGLEFCQPLFI